MTPTRITALALAAALTDHLWGRHTAFPTERDTTLLDALNAWTMAEQGGPDCLPAVEARVAATLAAAQAAP